MMDFLLKLFIHGALISFVVLSAIRRSERRMENPPNPNKEKEDKLLAAYLAKYGTQEGDKK